MTTLGDKALEFILKDSDLRENFKIWLIRFHGNEWYKEFKRQFE